MDDEVAVGCRQVRCERGVFVASVTKLVARLILPPNSLDFPSFDLCLLLQ